MELGWSAVIQAVIITVSTAVMRHYAKKDTARTIAGTAAQSTSDEILQRLIVVETKVEILNKYEAKRALVDHRAPTRGE